MRQRAVPQTYSSPVQRRRPFPYQQSEQPQSRSLSPSPLTYRNKKTDSSSSMNRIMSSSKGTTWENEGPENVIDDQEDAKKKNKWIHSARGDEDEDDDNDMIDPYRQRQTQTPPLQHPLQEPFLSPRALAFPFSSTIPSSTATPTTARFQSPLAIAPRSDPEILHDQLLDQHSNHLPHSHSYNNNYPERYYQNGEVFFRKTGNKRRTRPEDFHTVYRTPHHVPDRKFKEYLLRGNKQTTKQQQHSGEQGPVPVSMINDECMSRSCLGFSLVAVLFFLLIGFLYDTQPLYIKGSLPSQLMVKPNGKMVQAYLLPKVLVSVDVGDSMKNNKKKKNSKSNNSHHKKYRRERLVLATISYQAAMAYAFTAIVCWYRLNRGWLHTMIKKRQNRYEEIPDHYSYYHHRRHRNDDNDDGTDDQDTTTTSAIPTEGSRAYQSMMLMGGDSLYSRLKASLRQWFATRGWFFFRSGHRFRRKREPKCV